MKELYFEQFIKKPISEVFDFYGSEKNLELITPEFLHFKVFKTSTPTIQKGTLLDYHLKLHGIPMHWQTLIEEWQPRKMFVDRQLKGPYKLWRHTHEFYERDGGTLVIDKIEYEIPWGFMGNLLAGKIVARDLQKIFEYRYKAIEGYFANIALSHKTR